MNLPSELYNTVEALGLPLFPWFATLPITLAILTDNVRITNDNLVSLILQPRESSASGKLLAQVMQLV